MRRSAAALAASLLDAAWQAIPPPLSRVRGILLSQQLLMRGHGSERTAATSSSSSSSSCSFAHTAVPLTNPASATAPLLLVPCAAAWPAHGHGGAAGSGTASSRPLSAAAVAACLSALMGTWHVAYPSHSQAEALPKV